MQKNWYKSKATIGAILVALGAVGGYLTGNMDLVTSITAAAAALGIFGIRDAQK